MPISAGLLPFRMSPSIEVLIAHPGGPFWARKDLGSWSVIKGLVEDEEDVQAAARREFTEETGWMVPDDVRFMDLGTVTLKSRKIVHAWAFEGDFDPATLSPGHFEMEWRGRLQSFPEVDRVMWAEPPEARRLLNPAQVPFVDRVIAGLG